MKREIPTLFQLPNAAALVGVVLLMLIAMPMQAQTEYIGNNTNLPPNGGPDTIQPFVILGEYNPAEPLTASTSSVRLPAGSVQDVKFYGQFYINFTLYALAYVGPGPNSGEQVFRVDTSQSFPNATMAGPTNITLQVTNFPVNCGDLLAFAGIGPYYSINTNLDQPNNDATYENSISSIGYIPFLATAPGGRGSVFTNGIYTDPNATYEYISNRFENQGRNYAIGVDVLLSGTCSNDCLNISCPYDYTNYTCSNCLAVAYALNGNDICATNFTLISDPPSRSVSRNFSGSGSMTVTDVFCLGKTTVKNTAFDSQGHMESCSFTVTILPCSNNCPFIAIGQPTETCNNTGLESFTVPGIGSFNAPINTPSETFSVGVTSGNTPVDITWTVSSPGRTAYTTLPSAARNVLGLQLATVRTADSVWTSSGSSSLTTIPLVAGITYTVTASAGGTGIPTNCLPLTNSATFSVTNCPQPIAVVIRYLPNNANELAGFLQTSCNWFTFSPPASTCQFQSDVIMVYTIPIVPNIASMSANAPGQGSDLFFVDSKGGGANSTWSITPSMVSDNIVFLFVRDPNTLSPVGENGSANAGPHGGGSVAFLTFLALAIAFQLLRTLRQRQV